MRTTIFDAVIKTLPHGIEVPVKVEFSDYEGGNQFIVLSVGNPACRCRRSFNPLYNTRWHFRCGWTDDMRMETGGNEILHGYTLEEAKVYASMMLEQFVDEVHYTALHR